MLDLSLLIPFIWCTICISRLSVHRALLYTGGIFTAGYVAFQLSSWIQPILAVRAIAVFHWFEVQVIASPPSVATLATFLPSVSTLGSVGNLSHWIAWQVFRSILSLAMTLAIFLIFVVVAQVSNALWDEGIPTQSRSWHRYAQWVLAAACGLYVTLLCVKGIVSFAWVKSFAFLALAIHHSLFVTWIADALVALRGSGHAL